jgi:2-desacetyl-2-hydroxyethyl bacteriochlorophyllide A dehydrogenase
MKRLALYFTAPYQVSVREELLLPPGPQQVLVKTMVSAISAGTERLIYRGEVPTDLAIDETIGALGSNQFCFPLKYGYATVGEVIAIGAEVEATWLNQLVFAFNPHESHFLASPTDLIPITTTLLPENAVFLPNMETAVSFLMDSQPVIGEQVVIFGQGVVGLLTTMLLTQFPLANLITLDYYPIHREWSLKLGADASLEPTTPNILPYLQTLLRANHPDAGADLTYELSGNPQALDQAIQITGFSGRILIGSWYGQKRADLNLGSHFHRSQMRLISSQVSHIASRWRARWNKNRRLQVALSMLEKHQPSKFITHRFPISQAAEAYRLLDQEAEKVVQIVFSY